ncbi:uncharacterized protein METZ01_LOCUS405724, partial [marine metagenome]
GSNNLGSLGDGTNLDRHSPVKVVDSGVVDVAAGLYFSLFLKEDGSVWAMGRNQYYNLGDGTNQGRNSPVKVVDSGVVAVTAGGAHSQIVKTDGSLWSVGANAFGQLGDGTTSDRNVWTKVLDAGVRDVTAAGPSVFVFADPNKAPTDLTLTPGTILENQPAGTIVGDLNVTDPDAFLGPQSFAYSFDAGNGSTHNHLFSLAANGTIRANSTLDHEAHAALSIRVKVTDDHNASLQKAFAISVTNVVEDLDGDGIEDHADPDDDGDGFSDAMELAYGSDPR